MVGACDEKRGTLRRKEGGGNEGTEEKEERNLYLVALNYTGMDN